MNPTNPQPTNQPTNPQGENMTDNNETRRAIWTRTDGTTTEGPADEMMRRYAASGFAGSLAAVEPGQSAEDAAEAEWFAGLNAARVEVGLKPHAFLSEDTDDEPTEDAAPRAVLMATPSATVGQREPVTVESRAAMVTRRESAAERTGWAVDEKDLHADDVTAAAADVRMLEKMGLTPGRTLFAPGTPLVSWGLDKWRQERTNLGDRPGLHAAASAVIGQVINEQREDLTIQDPTQLRLVNDGGALVLLDSPNASNGVRLERSGLYALGGYYGRKGDAPPLLPPASFMSSMESDEIAELFNGRARRVLTNRSPVMLRTREASDGAGRSLYGVVSTQYGICDADEVARMLRDEVSDGAHPHRGGADPRASLVYDPNTTRLDFEITSMRDTPPVVGEVWKMGFKGSTGDAGGSGHRYQGMGAAFRAICCNLTTEELETAGLHQRHRGGNVADKIRQNIREGWGSLAPWFAEFANRWEVLSNVAAVDVLGGADMAEAIERLVVKTKHGKDLAAASGIKRDALVQVLLQSHSHEPGESLADVVNAVTRMHRERVPARLVSKVEAVAGLMARDLAGTVSV
jgi:hypothetical protein